MKNLRILRNQFFYVGLILLIGFWLRLYKVDSPIADWHSWRQADTAAVTRNFIKFGFNPFLPRFDDTSAISERPTPNPLGFRFVEFPVYNIFVYPFYLIFGVLETYHRLVSAIFSTGSIIFLYLITRKYTNVISALLTSLVFALLPFNVFFSRTTLPEPTLVFFALGMIYFVDKWIWYRKKTNLILGFIFTSLSFLIKPWAIFFFLPLFYSVYIKGGRNFFFKKFLPFTIVSILPFLFWRLWIFQHPEGIPASSWLLNGDNIRFRPAFFWWIISERIGGEILGVAGFFLFLFGLIFRPKNNNLFLHFWALSLFLFFIIFATGNVRHNYYQIIFVPVAAIFVSQGFINLIKGNSNFIPRIYTLTLALLLFPLMFYFSWRRVEGFYQINNPVIIEAGRVADELLPKDAVVLAPYNGDTAFLYQINRQGWAMMPSSIKELIADYGVTHYISTAKDSRTAWVMRHFQIIKETKGYVIADLRKITKEFDNQLDPEPR